jgi:hypothetical protein
MQIRAYKTKEKILKDNIQILEDKETRNNNELDGVEA